MSTEKESSGLPTIVVKNGEADRVLSGHPWIYEGSILRITSPAADGELVQVKDNRHRFLGLGFFNSKSKIRVRVVSMSRRPIDAAFFEERIRAALAMRQRYMPTATSYRVVNAEGDYLSGLIVDKYEDVLVVQTSSLGMDQRKETIVSVLEKIFSPRAILERNDVASRKFEGLEVINGKLTGSFDAGKPHDIQMNGLCFEADLMGGHKTGIYLDQQVNYKLVQDLAALSKGARALDCFSFIGGFALHLGRAGVANILGIDQSADACAAATRNAARNGLAEKCTFETANAFDWLKNRTLTGPDEKLIPQFDIIILDPPSFTRNRAAIPDALRGYKEIHLRALKLLRPGGVLATFCCSHHIDSRLFMEAIINAAFDARKVLRRVSVYGQSPDHPVIPTIPETEYLKGFAFEVAF